jgi:hypothetical protein
MAVSPLPCRTIVRPLSRTTQACIGSRVTSRFDQVLTHQRCIGSASRVTAPRIPRIPLGRSRATTTAHAYCGRSGRLAGGRLSADQQVGGRGCAAPGGAGAGAGRAAGRGAGEMFWRRGAFRYRFSA